MAEHQHFQLPDGRSLAYRVLGKPDGFPLVWFHGTPAASQPPPSIVAAAEQHGVKIIAPSRPGYNDSSRQVGRRVVDTVADIQALNEHLGVKTCLVAGWSGGGPDALACGARLPGVLAVLTIASIGPADAEDLDFLDGYGEANVMQFQAAMKGEEELRKFCAPQREYVLSGTVADAVGSLSSILSSVDVAACSGELGVYFVEVLRDGLRGGIDGWIDDDLEFVRPWGFSLDEIRVPVLLYQGSEDKMVPYAHGQWLAGHLPKEQLREHLVEGEGHISLLAKGQDLLSELLETGKLSL